MPVEGIKMSKGQTVVAVRLRYNPKAFWFDPALSTYEAGDHVLVDTERGREVGLVVDGALEVTEKQIKELKTPLKPVIRVLSEHDFDIIDELDAKGKEAMPIFRELIEKHKLDMKPVSVEFLFTGDKAVFYFSNDERIDFRDLVRDLASHFRIRVDMRQIGVRDEARILGGLAHCGEELCCARLGGEFQPVSIRIAKEQDLPLNPSKISGACGRLMCCLRYEFEAYRDFKTRAPKRGALIETPIGQAKVIDFDTPREIIMMRLEDGKQLSIPLSEFNCTVDESGKKHPCSVSKEAIHRCASSGILLALAALEQELAPIPLKATKKFDFEPDGEGTERSRSERPDRDRSRSDRSDRPDRPDRPDRERPDRPEHDRDHDRERTERNRPTRRPRRSGRHAAEGDAAHGATSGSDISQRTAQQRQPRPARHPQQSRPSASEQQTLRTSDPSQRQQSTSLDDSQEKAAEKRGGITPRKRNAAREKARPRPGQHSSSLRAERNGPQEGGKPTDRFRDQQGSGAGQGAQGAHGAHGTQGAQGTGGRVDRGADKGAEKRPGDGQRRRWRRSNPKS